MNTDSDTIAAISTGAGLSGIAVVRVSGPDALRIADTVFRGPDPRPSQRAAGTLVHGHVAGGANMEDDLDEVVLLLFHAPQSYTREDVVEIQGHGGMVCGRRVLRAVLEAGARPAEPGEFTRRAFLSGRIDLLQAEAVADLVSAKSERAAAAALEQLDGSLSCLITMCYDSMMSAAADVSATLDFSEGELPATTVSDIVKRLEGVGEKLADALATWDEGHLLRDGALVAIAGRPNVGKSTLLNHLLGTERAIVADAPGTTRDTIEEQLVLDGIPIRLVDTAGLRDAECHIERAGVERAETVIARADLILYMVDASGPLDDEDRQNLARNDPARCLVLLNKTDLGEEVSASDFPEWNTVPCSCVQGVGLEEVVSSLVGRLGVSSRGVPSHAVISERHRHIIQNVLNELNIAIQLVCSDPEGGIVLASDHLRVALEGLGRLTGRVYTEDLLEAVFSRFCVGK